MPLTDSQVRNLKLRPDAADRLVADGNGLYLRLRRAGGDASRTWLYRRKDAGQLTVVTLGTYPALAIREARLKAAELALKRSVDSPTVEVAAAQWLTESVDRTHKRADLTRGYIDRGVIPALGTRRVREIEAVDIARAVRAYRDASAKGPRGRAGGLPAARGLLATFKGLFRYCTENGWIDRSPAAQVTATVIGPAQVSRDRVLSDDEIRVVMTVQSRLGPVTRFLLLTGLRISEAYDGHREGQFWIVPASAAKNGREHRVWLSKLALAQLEASPWQVALKAVQRQLKVNGDGWTAHDLRRTFATRLNGMGVAPYVVERCLNHTFSGVMQVYNRADYETERREALEKWSAWLEWLTVPEPVADVIQIRDVQGIVARSA